MTIYPTSPKQGVCAELLAMLQCIHSPGMIITIASPPGPKTYNKKLRRIKRTTDCSLEKNQQPFKPTMPYIFPELVFDWNIAILQRKRSRVRRRLCH